MTIVTTRKLLGIQIRVIGALAVRETRVAFGKSQLGYLWAVLTPTASVGFLIVIFSFAGRSPAFGPSMALFFGTGVLTLNFFRSLSNKLSNSLSANKALLTYPLIKETDVLISRFILVSATFFVIMLIFYSALILLDFAEVPFYPHQVLQAFAATALLGFGFGTINAIIASLWASWSNIEKILTSPLFFVSGVFYVPSSLPPEAINILKWNPVLHLIEWFRVGFYGNYSTSILDRSYPLGVAMILILLGLCGERIYRKKRAGL